MKIGLTRKFMAMFFTLCMAISFVPIPAFAENSAVSNATQLEAALEDANRAEIKLGGNIELSTGLDVERAVTLDLNGYTLSCSLTDEDIFTIRSNGNLTVKDSGTGGKIDGQNKNCGFNVKGGILTLESGSIVNCTDANGDGGAVDVANTGVTETPIKYGKFVMNGGAIMDCKASDDGGAVDIGSGCIFVMNVGTIVNCRADDDGGAVFIKQRGNFELNGGLIQNCSSGANGGAVNIYQDGHFTMTAGTIKDCKVGLDSLGNAIYGSSDKAVVTMTGGTVEDCGASPYSFEACTVTFDSDGGSTVSEQKLLNAPAVKPADPKKSGYKFDGWYLEDTQYAFDTNVTKDITLKAHWTSVTPSEKYTVTYTDGVDNEEIFKDQTYTVKYGTATPAFDGTPARKGYTFAGWKPEVAATVTSNATYEATWKADSASTTTTPDGNKPGTDEATGTKTGDTSNIALWIALLFVSGSAAIATTVVRRKKKYNR